jgi:hypothetical protein
VPISSESPRTKALRSLPMNSWVAFSNDESRVIATGSTYDEVVKNSDAAGEADPVIMKTPQEWLPLSV